MRDIGRRTFLKTAGATAASVGVAGCAGFGGSSDATLTISATGLPELPQGSYQGWAVVDGEKVPADYVDSLTEGTERSSELPSRAGDAEMVVVTVEPEGDDDDTPSGAAVLAGQVQDGAADLSFPVDLTGASGGFTLATPSDGPANPTAGVWFIEKTGSPPPAPALDVPELPEGWVYEGWAKLEGAPPITTGRFRDPTAADGFGGFSGDQGVPPRPGEDFISSTDRAPDGVEFPVDLTAQPTKIVLSVEPDVDGSDPAGLTAPFPIKPLVGAVPDGADPGTLYDLGENFGTIPGGSATIE